MGSISESFHASVRENQGGDLDALRSKPSKHEALPPIPGGLIEAIKNKRVVLFLGAGASMESRGDKGEKPTSAKDLRDRLALDFLGKRFDTADLMSVADMAIESAGPNVVFEKIRSLLAPLAPTRAHRLLPTFRWRAIVTTNYDDLIEKAYRAGGRHQLQNIVPIVKNSEPVEELLQSTERPLMARIDPDRISRELSVGEVAARSGVAVSALHFYESKGLIRSGRNSGNQRRYPREVLQRVAILKVAQRTGIPLSAIQEALSTLPALNGR